MMNGITATANDAAGAEFLDGFARICAEHKQKEMALCRQLRADGVKALHPDDGWVKRLDENTIQFQLVYPRFQMSFDVGDRVAFGGVTTGVTIYTVTRKIHSVWVDNKWEAAKA